METETDPSTEKLWNYQDLRNASTSWNMKGDKALLDILQNIHNNVLVKATNTTEKLNTLSSDISNASISLMNVNNKFTSLGNTQFIENKVQDDDEMISKSNVDIPDATIIYNKEQVNLDIINMSLKKLESVCEKFHISADSDSGSDDSDFNDMNSNVILRPKDIYINKPLPYIIGSDKWQKNWHLGLQECTSESDSLDEPISKKDDLDYSSSDEFNKVSTSENSNTISKKKSQMTLPIPQHNLAANELSGTSSSTNNSTDNADSEVAKINAVKNNSVNKHIDFSGESNDNDVKQVPQKLVKASDFAAELAKKLGGNIDQEPVGSNVSPERPIKNNIKSSFVPVLPIESTNRVTGNIFSDEPPPVDTQDSNKDRPHDNFLSDNDNMEDDISNELFGDDSSSIFHSSSSNNLFSSSNISKNKQIPSGRSLFDDHPKENIKKPSINNIKHSSLFDDDDTDDDLFNTKSLNKNVVSTKNIASKNQTYNSEQKKEEPKKNSKPNSIFDDVETSDDDLFGSSNYFSNINVKKNEEVKKMASVNKESKSLFDDLSDSDDDLFKTNITVKKTLDLKNPENTTHDSTETETNKTNSNMISNKSDGDKEIINVEKQIKKSENRDGEKYDKDYVFHEKLSPTEKSNSSKNDEIRVPQESSTNQNLNISNDNNFDVPPPFDDFLSNSKETRKVLDDYEDDDDDLFGMNKSNNSDLFSTKYDYSLSSKNVNIFSDEPPDFDEQHEAQTDLLSDASLKWSSLKVNNAIEKVQLSPKLKSSENENKSSVDEHDNLFSIRDNNILISVDDIFTNNTKKEVTPKVDVPQSLKKSVSTNIEEKNISSVEQTHLSEKKDISENNEKTKSRESSIQSLQSKLFDQVKIDKENEKSVEKIQNTSPKAVKKIQMNVNINVKALMPTSMPKSIKEIKNTVTENDSTTKQVDGTLNDYKNEPEHNENSDILDNTLCNDIIKDRVKIKVKRRPSSRKARHEAIRKSAADIYNIPDTTEYSDNNENSKSLPNSPEKNVTSTSTIGTEHKNITGDNFKSVKTNDLIVEEKTIFPNIISPPFATEKKENLFDDDEDDNADLFSTATNLPEKPKSALFEEKPQSKLIAKKAGGLFDDSDSDSDLFVTKPIKGNSNPTSTKNSSNSNKVGQDKKAYNSIFGDSDDDDDDDLFTTKKPGLSVTRSKLETGLFDDDNSDEIDLFKTNKEITPDKNRSNIKPSPNQSEKPLSYSANSSDSVTNFQDPLSMFLKEQ